MKPACVNCGRFYRPHKNGIEVAEQMPGIRNARPGVEGKEDWVPYKVWQADLWVCKGCGHQLVVGFGMRPIAEHYEGERFKIWYDMAKVKVYDC